MRAEEAADLVAKSWRDLPRLIELGLGERYEVGALLGQGGMGSVFELRDRETSQLLAIKLISSHTRDRSTLVRRFEREAHAAAAVKHTNVCDVLRHGTLLDKVPYLIMERLPGESLRARLHKLGRLPLADVVTIGDQMLGGLAAAHAQGVLHRDVKPENVFVLSAPGAPIKIKLIDFGLARLLPSWLGDRRVEQTGLTATNVVPGTPHYLSPEQVLGEKHLDARVDVWACGLTLYEAVTGVRPFAAPDSTSLARKILHEPVLPASSVRSDLPLTLDPVISRSLAKRRADRFASAAEFRLALLEVWAAHRATALIHARARRASTQPRPPVEATTDIDIDIPIHTDINILT